MTINANTHNQFFSLKDIGKHNAVKDFPMSDQLVFATADVYRGAEMKAEQEAIDTFKGMTTVPDAEAFTTLQKTAIELITQSGQPDSRVIRIAGPALGNNSSALQFVFQNDHDVEASFSASPDSSQELPATLQFSREAGTVLSTRLPSGNSITLATHGSDTNLEVGTPAGSHLKLQFETQLKDGQLEQTPPGGNYQLPAEGSEKAQRIHQPMGAEYEYHSGDGTTTRLALTDRLPAQAETPQGGNEYYDLNFGHAARLDIQVDSQAGGVHTLARTDYRQAPYNPGITQIGVTVETQADQAAVPDLHKLQSASQEALQNLKQEFNLSGQPGG